jgi:hypothetical protein
MLFPTALNDENTHLELKAGKNTSDKSLFHANLLSLKYRQIALNL